MTDKKTLNEEELEKISGGRLTKECDEWLTRNGETIKQRAKANKQLSALLYQLFDTQLSSKTITIEEYKRRLKSYGIDCDDLM